MERRVPWPDGIQCPVALDFHLDAESLLVAIDPANARRPITLSQWTYGPRAGLPRILRLLRKYGIRASFYIPAITAERHPYAVEAIHAEGHEIGLHGYTHRRPDALTPDEEEEELTHAIEVLERVTGQKMRSYISPAAEYSMHTLGLLIKYGLEFGADGMDDDVPYYVEIDGEQTDFLQLPLNFALDDAPLYWFNLLPALFYGGPYAEPSRVYELWTTEFDALYDEGAVYHLCMHPFLSGRGARVRTLERVIQYIMLKPDAKFVTLGDIADMYRAVVPKGKGRPGAWYALDDEPRVAKKVDGVPILA